LPTDVSPCAPPATSPSPIDLWLAFEADIQGGLLQTLGHLLSPPEREQQQRFRAAEDRHRYLVTRALVRTVLSRYADVAPHEWEFTATPYGRPEIAPAIVERSRRAQDLCFNISHTRGLVVVGVGRQRRLGVDVESLVVPGVPPDIVDHVFSPAERAAFARLPAEQQPERFWEYWTFKESYIKAQGKGLSLPLDRFSIHFPDARHVGLSIDDADAREAGHWLFWQFKPSPDHLLAICTDSAATGIIPSLSLRRVVPTVSEQLMDVPLLRRSACSPSGF
jgi:4'-phosphopantetheinyl transferase